MPRISAFYGITIWMYFDEGRHPGRPHFHARYGEWEASIEIESLKVISGDLPGRALWLIREWGSQHRAALAENWQLARDSKPLVGIEPLP